MTEIPDLPRNVDFSNTAQSGYGTNASSSQSAKAIPAYRANLPSTIEGLEQERQDLTLERESKNRGANTLLVLGMCCGAAAFILPLNSCSSQLGGPATLVNALNAFVVTLVGCVLVGVVFGSIAASLRSRVKFIDSRLRAIESEKQQISQRQAKGESGE